LQFEPKDQFEQRQRKLEKNHPRRGTRRIRMNFAGTAAPAELAAKYSGATAPELEANKIEAAIAGAPGCLYRLMGKGRLLLTYREAAGRLQIYGSQGCGRRTGIRIVFISWILAM